MAVEMNQVGSIQELLLMRSSINDKLTIDQYSIKLYFDRSKIYECLGYPDLAAMDLYKSMLLIDEVTENSSESHDEAVQSLSSYIAEQSYSLRKEKATCDMTVSSQLQNDTIEEITEEECILWAEKIWLPLASIHLAYCLTTIGCFRDAYTYVKRALNTLDIHDDIKLEIEKMSSLIHEAFETKGYSWKHSNFEVSQLPNSGLVRREVYPWNFHEQQRNSESALQLLNEKLSEVAPLLEVRLAELPLLSKTDSTIGTDQVTKQLGLFAKTDLSPGKIILIERSMLTANSRLHEPLCDACSAPLPSSNDFGRSIQLNRTQEENQESLNEHIESNPVPCTECEDIIFCSQECHDLAQSSYHPAVCGTDVESIAKDAPIQESADALHSLLLLRALAMSITKEQHPLELDEVKYIWGDFKYVNNSGVANADSQQGRDRFTLASRTLPFTFSGNILTPLHMLEKMDIDIYTADNDLAEAWVFNTLYAKFRGTASARISPRDGRPEVAAVHPLWCLANHSCDPNVEWEWAGEIKFKVRQQRVIWQKTNENGLTLETKDSKKAKIKMNEQILNNYVDINLPVKDRREWGLGSLGGNCMCERCRWENTE